jgi:Asp-tRNA(Asn)/Glu-tRNA(Gln) amidotransferase A subunit family amidase
MAKESSSQPAVNPATTQAASAPANDIGAADVASADRIAGRDYHSDADREMMRDGLASKRETLRSLHTRHIPPDVEPAIHFTARLPVTPLPPGPSACTVSAAPLPDYSGNVEDLAFYSAADLSRLVHARKVTSVQLTEMYLHRLKEIGGRLNCVVTLTESLALRQAKRADEELAAGKSRGPLHGLPYGTKDLLAVRDYPTTWGAKPFENQTFDYDATVVTKLEAAGAVHCAKLSLGELAMGDVWFKGLTRNPWNPKTGSSGSSAGPCAATAAGLVALAIGSETMGSIISPCMVNGTTGLRPTYGRVSRYGAMALSRTMDKLGPITRGVEDAALVLAAISGPDPRDPTAVDLPYRWDPASDLKQLRVGYDPTAFDAAAKHKNEQRRQVYADALAWLQERFDLRPVTLPPVKNYAGIAGLTIAAESASSFTELLATGHVRELVQQDEGSWPNTFRIGSTIPASDYLRAQQVRTQLQYAMHEAMKDVDLMVTLPYHGPTLAYTNLAGHPTLVTRCGVVGDKPVLLEFLGQPFREDAILRLAFEYEKSHDWTKLWPDTSRIPALASDGTLKA